MNPIVNLSIDDIKKHLYHHKFILASCKSYQSIMSDYDGFQTYAPLGLEIKNKIISEWRKLFIKLNVHEIESPILLSQEVLTNSGHIAKFNDYVVTNGKNTVRADHLIEDFIQNNKIDLTISVNDMTPDEMLEIIKKYKMINYDDNDINSIKIIPQNLMFKCDKLYLRPEIAQGIFTEFENFYDNNLPFGLAQVGKSYRNEISSSPFTRLREFTQAEVEYFFDPDDSSHPLYDTVKLLELPFENNSNIITMSIINAVTSGIIINEIMAYWLGTIYKFAKNLGLDDNIIRFRQHKKMN